MESLAQRIRRLIPAIALGCVMSLNSASAQDGLDWRGYFPLEIGNVWQYYVDVPHEQHGFPIAVWRIEWLVAADTTLEEESYYLIEGRCDTVWAYAGLYGQPCDPARVDSVFVRYDLDLATVVRYRPSDDPCRSFFFARDFRLDVEETSMGPSPLGCAVQYEYTAPELMPIDVGSEVREYWQKHVTSQDTVSTTRYFAHGLGMTDIRTCAGGECVERTMTYARVGDETTGEPKQIPRTSLLVSSTSPDPFATSVSLTGTLDVAFTEPLQWSEPADALRFLVTPGSAMTEGPAPGASQEVATLDVQHDADTDYTWVIAGALANAGAGLELPHVLRYTTAGSWGASTVSGRIPPAELAGENDVWVDPRRIVVILLREEPADAILANLSDAGLAAAARVAADYTFEITRVRPGTYWPVAVLDADGDGDVDDSLLYPAQTITVGSGNVDDVDFGDETGVSVEDTPRPSGFLLDRPYPNPASERFTIRFALEKPAVARVELYNALGQRVATVREPGHHAAGEHVVEHPLGTLSAGWYFVRLTAGDRVEHRGVVVVR